MMDDGEEKSRPRPSRRGAVGGSFALAVAPVLLLGAGCASGHWAQRDAEHAKSAEAPDDGDDRRNSTIGVDKSTAPAGQTIPASGLGVDMVERPTKGASPAA